MKDGFSIDYRVAIDTVPLPEEPVERLEVIMRGVVPIINQIVNDAMTMAIGTLPTPEEPGEKLPD
jgi:hypothetical protein